MEAFYEDDAVRLHLGDCLDILPTLPDASVDAIVCDPPYGLADHHPRVIAETLAAWLAGDRASVPDGRGFMGREWDRFVPPPAVWDECLRVLKPGGHLMAFAAPRTVDLMTLSIRLSGFEIRDSLHWVFGSGMPKGQNIGKAIDKRRDDREQVLRVTAFLAAARTTAGLSHRQIDEAFGFNGMASHWTTLTGKAAIVPTPEQWDRLRELLGFDDTEIRPLVAELNGRKGEIGEAWLQREVIGQGHRVRHESDVMVAPVSTGAYDLTSPATDAAKQWNGWNTQLRPAHEPIVLARKSTGFNTTVANVLEHGTGALNVDACRTEAAGGLATGGSPRGHRSSLPMNADQAVTESRERSPEHPGGRWPTNILLGHGPNCIDDGECQPECPVAEMDAQSGVLRARGNRAPTIAQKGATGVYGEYSGAMLDHGPGDSGGASRFFPVFRYEAKAPASERPRLADGTAHTTVKPLTLMRWLVRLITPPGGTVLDPFAGSGTTLEACRLESFQSIGIEKDPAHAELCKIRLAKPYMTDLFGGAA